MSEAAPRRSNWVACVDAGNTRTKLYSFLDAKSGGPRADLLTSWTGHERGPETQVFGGAAPRVCILSSVASPAATERLVTALRGAWGTEVEVIVNPSSGLELRIQHPETVGADRLFAARGALLLGGESCIVVDAGTAMTVDAVEATGERGAFLGGAIAPGPDLLAESLVRRGARLQDVRPEPGARALGRHTREALLAGVVVGFEGAAVRLVQRIAEEAGCFGTAAPGAEASASAAEGIPVMLCGGAAHFLDGALVAEGFAVQSVPELVAYGLAAAWSSELR